MGDTVKEQFTNEWSEITGLTLAASYSFQNVNSEDLFLQQVPNQPGIREIGKRLKPSDTATIVKETSPVWVRSKVARGIAYYNETV